jgi:hypothetical protein
VCSPRGRRCRFFPAEIKQSYHKVEHSQADDPNDWMFISDLGYHHVIDGLLATWDTDGLLEGAGSFGRWLWTIQGTSGHPTRCRSPSPVEPGTASMLVLGYLHCFFYDQVALADDPFHAIIKPHLVSRQPWNQNTPSRCATVMISNGDSPTMIKTQVLRSLVLVATPWSCVFSVSIPIAGCSSPNSSISDLAPRISA